MSEYYVNWFFLLEELHRDGSTINRATPSSEQSRAKPGAALQTLPSFIDSLIHLLILFLPWLYSAAMPKRFEIAIPVMLHYVAQA